MVATHDVDFAAEWADEVIILQGGKLVVQGQPDLLIDEKIMSELDLAIPTITKAFLPWCRRDNRPLPKNIMEARKLLSDQ